MARPFGEARLRLSGRREQSLRRMSERSVFIDAAGPAIAGQAWGLALCAAVVRHRR